MRTDRLLKIIYICLQRDRVTAAELADKLEVSRRTVFRDLEALGAAGFPIVSWPGAGGGVGLIEGFKLDKSLLTDEDFSRLATALGSIQSIDGNKDVALLMDKLIPPEKRGADGGDIIIDLSSWFEDDAIDAMFAQMRAAIAQRRYISLAYSTNGIYTERMVEPYKLVFKYQSWYLYAFCLLRGDFRLFKLTRVSRYSLAQEQFAPRKLGDMVFQLQGQAGQGPPLPAGRRVAVALRYAVADRELLMDRLGAQDFKDEGESGTVRFSTTNLPWVTDIVMALQDRVEVLRPAALRAEVRRRIERMRAVYEADDLY